MLTLSVTGEVNTFLSRFDHGEFGLVTVFASVEDL